jgi:hypothetical protein
MSSSRSLSRPLGWRFALVLALIVLGSLAVTGAIDPLQSGCLTMLPALALASMMLTRPYAGERTLARLRARRTARPDQAPAAAAPERPPARMVRGGRLIAVALAGRAPPRVLAGCP